MINGDEMRHTHDHELKPRTRRNLKHVIRFQKRGAGRLFVRWRERCAWLMNLLFVLVFFFWGGGTYALFCGLFLCFFLFCFVLCRCNKYFYWSYIKVRENWCIIRRWVHMNLRMCIYTLMYRNTDVYEHRYEHSTTPLLT